MICVFDFLRFVFKSYRVSLFSIGWLFWKLGRSSLLGWARLERLHRLIQQEQWEIEHHRAQEKEELTAMYHQKGLTGKLLEQVIEVLMADDNRLLRVMLEEELGLTLETYEHPGLVNYMCASRRIRSLWQYAMRAQYVILHNT